MNENEEIWRDIEGYEGLYQVSNLGKVKSLNYNHTNQEKILKFGKDRYGYLYVILCKNRKKKNSKVHRLVATAFIENPSNLSIINHKDENPLNNCVDNLEWCDAKYNTNYGTAIQRKVANTDYKSFQQKRIANTDWKAIAEKQSKKVYQYSLDLKLIKTWESTAECQRNGYNQGNVASCCRNSYLREGNNVYKNFIWSYTELKK